jgi:CubicO group peptidase (beta-lactamase class C family)
MNFSKIALALAAFAALVLPTASAQSAGRPEGPVKTPAPAAASPAPPPAGHPLERADLEAWLDGMVPFTLKSDDIAGGVIVVVKDGKVLLQKGYGYADMAKKTPMDPDRSLVRMGSTSKLFTWTAVMILVEQGKLDLDRDVNDYLDLKIPQKFSRPITLRDLMNHRAGFEEGLKDILSTDTHGLMSTEQYLKRHPRPLLFAPGEVPAYSNYGAALAGYIVQRVSHEPYERFVERHILLPLGMLNTSFDQPLPDRFKPDLALGYVTASGAPQPYEQILTRPAGSGTTTAADMAKFMLAHLQDGRLGATQIMSPQTAQLMHSPSEKNLPGFAVMAHGFFYETRNGRLAIGHGGDTIVFHTEMELLPAEGVGIYYTFSSRGKDNAVYGLREGLFNGFMDRYFPAPPRPVDPPALASAAKDAQEIAGLYWSSRRVEHGFISLFYMLQQAAITANPDGTITAPGALGGAGAVFREVGPQLWREAGGERQLALTHVRGVKTVVDSDDPTSVLQAVPALKAAPLTLTVLIVSLAILLWTLVLWPLAPLLRRGDRAPSGVPAETRRLRLFTRIAVLVDVVYLVAWYMLLQPLLGSQVQVYNPGMDPVVLTLEIAGLVVVAMAGVGLWVAWRTFKLGAPWLSRIWTVAVAAALLGVVWIAVMGKLLSFTLNY